MRSNKTKVLVKTPLAILVSVCLLALLAGTLHRGSRARLVVVNVKQALALPMQVAIKRLSNREQADFAKAYSQALPQMIARYGRTHHVTVVAAPVLVNGGGLDRTQVIIDATLTQVEKAHG